MIKLTFGDELRNATELALTTREKAPPLPPPSEAQIEAALDEAKISMLAVAETGRDECIIEYRRDDAALAKAVMVRLAAENVVVRFDWRTFQLELRWQK